MSQSMVATVQDSTWEQGAGSAQSFELRLAETGKQVLVRVDGPLDVEHSPEFLRKLQPLCGSARRVVADLRRADYIDSAGVRALLKLQGQLRPNQGELVLVVDPGSRAMRTLKLLRLDNQFRMFDRASDAWSGSPPPIA